MKRKNYPGIMMEQGTGKVITSKDIKKRRMKLAKQEYKQLSRFTNSQLAWERASAVKHYGVLAMGYFCSSIMMGASIMEENPELIAISGAIFLATLGGTGIEIIGFRKERKENIKPLKRAKSKYKEMYKQQLIKIKEDYIKHNNLEKEADEMVKKMAENSKKETENLEAYIKNEIKKSKEEGKVYTKKDNQE